MKTLTCVWSIVFKGFPIRQTSVCYKFRFKKLVLNERKFSLLSSERYNSEDSGNCSASYLKSVNCIQCLYSRQKHSHNTTLARVCNDVIVEKRRGLLSSKQSFHKSSESTRRTYCCDIYVGDEDEINGIDENNIADEVNVVLKDETYDRCMKQFCGIGDIGHKVFVLNVAKKGGARYWDSDLSHDERQLAENIALVESIPGWSVVDKVTVKTNRQLTDQDFLLHREFYGVLSKLRSNPSVSALFITVNELSAKQTIELQGRLNMPIFNRPFIIIQACKSHALTKEARVCVALAELPHMQFQFSIQQGRLVNYTAEQSLLRQRERKLKAILAGLKRQREKMRSQKQRHKIPTVAVIGYTNSGKTSLIKALTGDTTLMPENRLFATLDVTVHAGQLPNHLLVLYTDTMGFISNLPYRLRQSFSATLEHTSDAAAVVHVCDACNPDCEGQRQEVLHQLATILSPEHFKNIIQVYNKADMLHRLDRDPDTKYVSAMTGEGLQDLQQQIQAQVISTAGILTKKIRLPLNGPHLAWLKKEATLVSTELDTSPENLLVHVHISQANYSRFLAQFGPRRQ
ncbi:putative GTP-binding protein 6 [Mya arenaria]|uniref:putative GTP-binding protein 6 n=1 Tax=Mya arenaria TaxID=6604 RepID=UPI0022E1A8E0|nr:putative GTP-binding protein 6 [Mya arenaria]